MPDDGKIIAKMDNEEWQHVGWNILSTVLHLHQLSRLHRQRRKQ